MLNNIDLCCSYQVIVDFLKCFSPCCIFSDQFLKALSGCVLFVCLFFQLWTSFIIIFFYLKDNCLQNFIVFCQTSTWNMFFKFLPEFLVPLWSGSVELFMLTSQKWIFLFSFLMNSIFLSFVYSLFN